MNTLSYVLGFVLGIACTIVWIRIYLNHKKVDGSLFVDEEGDYLFVNFNTYDKIYKKQVLLDVKRFK